MFGQSVNKISSFQQAQQYQPPTPPEYSDEDIIIKFRAGITIDLSSLQTSSPLLNTTLKRLNLHKAEKFHKNRLKRNNAKAEKVGIDRIFRFTVPKGTDINKAIIELRRNSEVEYAEPDYIVKAAIVPNDPSFPAQWGLPKINAPAAWDINTGSSATVIAIIDTGIDRTHPDFAGNIWKNTAEIPGNGIDDDGNGYVDDVFGFNFMNYNNNSMDDNFHGTHVAGIAGAATNNAFGMAGVNWNVKLMPVKALNHNGEGPMNAVAAGIVYAADNGANVINMSLGSYWYSYELKDAIEYARSMGCVMVAAAGNDNSLKPLYPAALNHVISVGATDSSDNRASFSNKGPFLDVCAPGVGIYSTVLSGGYSYADGTSMAAPFVSGLAALLKSKNPGLNFDQIYQTIVTSADDLGPAGIDDQFGYGRVNALAALQKSGVLSCRITSPEWFSVINNTINIVGSVDGPNFDHYEIMWGEGYNPASWSAGGVLLSSGGSAQVSEGLLATLDTTQITNNGIITLMIKSYDTVGATYISKIIMIKNSFIKPGWPKAIGVIVGGSQPTIADINSDGMEEIIHERQVMHVWDSNGNDLPGWPAPIDYGVFSSVAVGNYFDNGGLGLAVSNFNTNLRIWNPNASIAAGWPRNITMFFAGGSQAVAGDINNDGKDEFICTTPVIPAMSSPNVHVLNGQGNYLPNWPKTLNVVAAGSPNSQPTPAIADMDNDGKKEIILPTTTGEMHILKADGSEMIGWPKTGLGSIGPYCSSPAIADVDGDNQLEIFMAFNGEVHGWKKDGSILAGWPKVLPGTFESALAIGDISGDSKPEIVGIMNGNGDKLYAFDYQGNVVPGFPVSGIYSLLAGPIIIDADGNGKNEIIAMNWDPLTVNAIKGDGTQLNGWPFAGINNDGSYYTPAAGDVDGDGLLELYVAGWHNVYCFDLPGLYNPRTIPWAMFHRDAKHTSCIPVTFDPGNQIISGKVNDGTGADIAMQTSTNILSANWDGFLDPETGTTSIKEYQYSIGKNPYGTDIVGWTPVGLNNNFTRTGLSLISGQKYYTTIRAVNGKGQYVDACSDGVLIEATPPAGTVNDGVGSDIDGQITTNELAANWNIIDPESGIANFEYSVGTNQGGTQLIGWTNAGLATSFKKTGLNLNLGQTYYVNIRATNGVGLTSIISSDGVRIMPEKYDIYNYPNPFSLSRMATKVRYELPADGKVTMQIFDSNGNLQKDLMSNQQQTGGIHEIEWDGKNSSGQKVNEAVYFCVIEVKGDSGKRSFKKIIKILVTK